MIPTPTQPWMPDHNLRTKFPEPELWERLRADTTDGITVIVELNAPRLGLTLVRGTSTARPSLRVAGTDDDAALMARFEALVTLVTSVTGAPPITRFPAARAMVVQAPGTALAALARSDLVRSIRLNRVLRPGGMMVSSTPAS